MKFLFLLLSLIYVFSSGECTPKSEQVFYYHYARDRPDTAVQLKTGVPLNSSINPKLPWKFFIHGWTTSPWVSPWFQTGKAAYFQHGEYNVVFVDWSKPGNDSYLRAVLNAMDSGKVFGKFLAHLNNNGVSLDDMHLLGHSLGSHMVGFAGKYMRDKVKKIGRITGLDPAAPFYENNQLLPTDTLPLRHPATLNKIRKINPDIFKKKKFLVPPELRLSDDDALFVDIIHTGSSYYGMVNVIGHCDFFPNSGYHPTQPGCESTDDDNCCHARSVTFFVESINHNNFVARKCPSYEEYVEGKCKHNAQAVMGEHTDHKTRGVYYLRTNASPPYGRGKEGRRQGAKNHLDQMH